jgi:hypothetical protein
MAVVASLAIVARRRLGSRTDDGQRLRRALGDGASGRAEPVHRTTAEARERHLRPAGMPPLTGQRRWHAGGNRGLAAVCLRADMVLPCRIATCDRSPEPPLDSVPAGQPRRIPRSASSLGLAITRRAGRRPAPLN